ncbi:MAG: hypothetical protein GX157_03025, partial [Candidatus Cloacimonetes bacterium]|nr:hypothetical protein [Candidatus Cloacimonadota bacterium]
CLSALSNSKKQAYIECLKKNNITLRGINEADDNAKAEILSDHYIRFQMPYARPQGTLISCDINDGRVITD